MFNKQLINGDTWVFMGRIYRIWYVTPMKVMKILRNLYAVVALMSWNELIFAPLFNNIQWYSTSQKIKKP